MRPPMKQDITLYYPILDAQGKVEKDGFGRPKLQPKTLKAHVQFSSRIIKMSNGEQKQATLEVDLHPDVQVSQGTEIEYVGQFETVKGQVISMDETYNLGGTKVYFRTVYAG